MKQKIIICDHKTQRRLIHNEILVSKLNEYWKTGEIYTQAGMDTYNIYKNLQIKLKKVIKYENFSHFEHNIDNKNNNNNVCDICGFPVTSLLENHHVIPKSKGGTVTTKLCPSCHCAVHKTTQTGNFDYVIEHLNNIVGSSIKFGKYVGLCL